MRDVGSSIADTWAALTIDESIEGSGNYKFFESSDLGSNKCFVGHKSKDETYCGESECSSDLPNPVDLSAAKYTKTTGCPSAVAPNEQCDEFTDTLTGAMWFFKEDSPELVAVVGNDMIMLARDFKAGEFPLPGKPSWCK